MKAKYFNVKSWSHTSRENRFASGLHGVVTKFVDTRSGLKPKRK